MSTEKDSGSYSQSNYSESPAPSQTLLPISPNYTNFQNHVGFSHPHEIFEDLKDFGEKDTVLEEETTVCESDDSDKTVTQKYSPPNTFVETQQGYIPTQGSCFTQLMKQKKPNFQSEVTDEFKLNPDYEHDKAIHKKKLSAVHRQLKNRNNRWYIYNPMLRNTHEWNSQTKNGYPTIKSLKKDEKSQKNDSQEISTQISPNSSPLPAPIFDIDTPNCSQIENVSQKIEQNAISSKNTESPVYENPLKIICPPTPPNDFKNSPIRQTRMYTTLAEVKREIESKQVKRKAPERDDNKENRFKEENEIIYDSHSPLILGKKPGFKQGAGLRRRIGTSLHFKVKK